jgi:hypothetical protein
LETDILDVLQLLAGIFGGKLTASSEGLAKVQQVQQGISLVSDVISTLPAGNTTTEIQQGLTALGNSAAIAIASAHISPVAPALGTTSVMGNILPQ